ncbi:MAG: aminomethyl transferase family protein [Candidatus Omnitrophica bacterium]|nr:aminomethyl transferase family protein [Candidatus Omnitrophota bacterium]
MPKKIPLADFWENVGATLKKEKDWLTPSVFRNFSSEAETVRRDVGVFDLSHRGKIEVRGKDRISFLHHILSNDIQGLGMGDGCYAMLLNAQGRILADLNLYVFANSVLLGTEAGLEKKVVQQFEKLHVSEEVEFKIVTGDWIVLSLQGPKSEALVGALIHGPVRVTEEFHHTNFQILETPATLIRRSVTGEKGFHLLIPREKGMPIVRRILEVGRPYGAEPVGFGALEILRIEAGIPRYGIDMDEKVMLPETGLEAVAASETKGCYPGQEVVARIKTYGGLNRKLCGLVFDKTNLPRAKDKVLKGKEEIGFVTSACHSPALGKGIALAYLQKGHFDSPEEVIITTAHRHAFGARVAPLPFI